MNTNLNHASAMEISLSTFVYLFRNATAASVMTANFSRMTLIASGNILSGAYAPSDSTQTTGLGQRPKTTEMIDTHKDLHMK
jgi:hypothetical protein